MKSSWFALLVLVVACSDRDKPEIKREPRRVIEPRSPGVRALPPHAIRPDGVGPYKIGDTVAKLLDQLPQGPRITQFTIPGIVQRDILRAEDDAILIGAEPQGKATFVAVVGAEIARTEGGIHVGSTREELTRGLGAIVDEQDRAYDPRVVTAGGLKNVRIVLEDDRIAAMVVVPEPERAKDGVDSVCTRPKADRTKGEFGACLTIAGETVRYAGDEIQVFAKDAEKPLAQLPVKGLVFAAAVRNPADGRDDLVAIARGGDHQSRTWSLTAFRVTDGKFAKSIEEKLLYQLTASNARWVGVELRDVELYLELAGRSDAIEVGGVLTTRANGKIRDIVVISPVQVSRRRVKPSPHEGVDAGTSDTASSIRGPR